MDILKNPTTVKMLATQVIRACDEYISMNLTEKQLRELMLHYACRHGAKLFGSTGSGFNPTVTNRIGKKRLELVKLMLDGFQLRLS